MTELNITALSEVDMWPYAHSIADGGDFAARNTWNSSLEFVRENQELRLCDDTNSDDIRDFFRGFGAWDSEEVEAWDMDELNARLLQFIAGDIREASEDDTLSGIPETFEPEGRLYGSAGEWFYMIGD